MLIQTYNPQWSNQFEVLQSILVKSIGHAIITIEHVGSTSVIGLAAKPIIDMDIVYEREEDFKKIELGLQKLGYEHVGHLGIPDRKVFKRKSTHVDYPELDSIKHHLYACISTSSELKRHVLFRDFLKHNEWARNEYQELKYSIAKEVNQDHKSYAALKEMRARPFIVRCLLLAQ